MKHNPVAARDFLPATMTELEKKNIFVIGVQLIADPSHPYSLAHSERVYMVSVDGLGKMLTHQEVYNLAWAKEGTSQEEKSDDYWEGYRAGYASARAAAQAEIEEAYRRAMSHEN